LGWVVRIAAAAKAGLVCIFAPGGAKIEVRRRPAGGGAWYGSPLRPIMDSCLHPYRMHSAVHGLSHGLKIARPLSIFTPVCAPVPPFQVPPGPKEKGHPFGCPFLLVREAGLEGFPHSR